MIPNTLEVERWYVMLSYNNNNSPVYVDMVKDMAAMQNGVFTCIFKADNGNICDYLVIEEDSYADFKPPAVN